MSQESSANVVPGEPPNSRGLPEPEIVRLERRHVDRRQRVLEVLHVVGDVLLRFAQTDRRVLPRRSSQPSRANHPREHFVDRGRSDRFQRVGPEVRVLFTEGNQNAQRLLHEERRAVVQTAGSLAVTRCLGPALPSAAPLRSLSFYFES